MKMQIPIISGILYLFILFNYILMEVDGVRAEAFDFCFFPLRAVIRVLIFLGILEAGHFKIF